MMSRASMRLDIRSERWERLAFTLKSIETKMEKFADEGSITYILGDPSMIGQVATHFRGFGFMVEIDFTHGQLFISWFHG
jgi:hypothetical protein